MVLNGIRVYKNHPYNEKITKEIFYGYKWKVGTYNKYRYEKLIINISEKLCMCEFYYSVIIV